MRSVQLKSKQNREGVKAVSFLKRCFSDEEWEWLNQQDSFRANLQNINDFNVAERLVREGIRLLSLAPQDVLTSLECPRAA